MMMICVTWNLERLCLRWRLLEVLRYKYSFV